MLPASRGPQLRYQLSRPLYQSRFDGDVDIALERF